MINLVLRVSKIKIIIIRYIHIYSNIFVWYIVNFFHIMIYFDKFIYFCIFWYVLVHKYKILPQSPNSLQFISFYINSKLNVRSTTITSSTATAMMKKKTLKLVKNSQQNTSKLNLQHKTGKWKLSKLTRPSQSSRSRGRTRSLNPGVKICRGVQNLEQIIKINKS